MLVGRASPNPGSAKDVVRVVPAENARREGRERRYLIPPTAVRQIGDEARRDGLDLIGFYHSHPDHPAEPSVFDREHAWPWYTYLIVAVAGGSVDATRAWRLADDRLRFCEEDLIITEEES